MKKTLALLLCAAFLVLLISGCGGKAAPAPSAPAAPDGSAAAEPNAPEESYPIPQLTIGTTNLVEYAVRGEYNYDMISTAATELPLVWQDTVGEFHPLLADYATEDATTWTYTIREGMTWDDGVPVTAEDILFTLQYEDSEGSANLISQTDAEGNETPAKYVSYSISEDGRSISLTLAAPNVRELSSMTYFRTMPKHVYEGKPAVTEAEARIGCGPYRFRSFDRNSGTLTFEANPDYPEKPNVSRLVYRFFNNEDTLYLALQNGDLDMVWAYSAGVAAAYQDVLAASDSVQLVSVPAVNVPSVLGFNNARGFFADENLRQAVASALDYSQFRTYFGSVYAGLPNRGFVPAATVGYADTDALHTDAGKAAGFMAAAGYASRNENGFFVNADGSEAGFTLTYNADKEVHAGCAELLKTQLEAFGIHVTLDGTDKDSYNAKTSNKFSENNITMEAALYGFTAAGMGMGSGLGSIYVDGNHAVQGGCQVFDPEFQEILADLADSRTPEEYGEAAALLQDYYAQHVPLLALYWDDLLLACSARYENLTADCLFGLNNVNNWFSITAK